MDEATLRRERRRLEIEHFLARFGVERAKLAASTRECLEEWARQKAVVHDQPSANWANVVLQLCRAVESEVANTLGTYPGLEFLADEQALGDMARRLSRVDPQAVQRLHASSVKVGVLGELARQLSQLAKLRRATRGAHGGMEIASATAAEAERAATRAGSILKRVQASVR